MADPAQEPKFEVVDDATSDARQPTPRVVVLRGWKAALVAAPLVAAASALLLAVAGLVAAGVVVGGTLLGAGLLARKLFSSGSGKKQLGQDSANLTKRGL